MAALSPEALSHIARIARLPLTPQESAKLAEEAGRILAQFEEVEAALKDTKPRVKAKGDAARTIEARADEVAGPDAAQAEAIVGQFPRREGRRAKVPEGL